MSHWSHYKVPHPRVTMVNRFKTICIVFVFLLAALFFQTYRIIELQTNIEEENTLQMKKINEYYNQLDSICNAIKIKSSSPTELIFNTMKFVNNNTTHLIDEERDRYLNIPRYQFLMEVINRIYSISKDGVSDKPHLSCGLRAELMQNILQRYQISARINQIFSTDGDKPVFAHRLLEVFNPEVKRWELWDPDNNVFFIEIKSGLRANSLQLLLSANNQIIPSNGTITGWNETGTGHLKNVDGLQLEPTNPSHRFQTFILKQNLLYREISFDIPISFKDYIEKNAFRLVLVNGNGQIIY